MAWTDPALDQIQVLFLDFNFPNIIGQRHDGEPLAEINKALAKLLYLMDAQNLDTSSVKVQSGVHGSIREVSQDFPCSTI